MRKKGAIGLSINTLVIIIISLVVLGSGITLLYNLIGGTIDIKSGLDQRTSQELERLLVDKGTRVALPLHTASIDRGENHVFGIGILNILPDNDQFIITIEISQVINVEEDDIKSSALAASNPNKWLLFNNEPLKIKENENIKEEILVNVPEDAMIGTYVYSARVYDANNEKYGSTQRFIVTVQ